MFGDRTRLVGIIKEVAPTKSVATDADLGVAVYEKEYFNHSLYMAVDLKDDKYPFHDFLGSRTVVGEGLSTWNPFSLVSDFFSLKRRLQATKNLEGKSIGGNLAGEGNVLGGIVVVRNNKVIWRQDEHMGSDYPYEELAQTITGETQQSDAIRRIFAESDRAIESMGQCDVESKECA